MDVRIDEGPVFLFLDASGGLCRDLSASEHGNFGEIVTVA